MRWSKSSPFSAGFHPSCQACFYWLRHHHPPPTPTKTDAAKRLTFRMSSCDDLNNSPSLLSKTQKHHTDAHTPPTGFCGILRARGGGGSEQPTTPRHVSTSDSQRVGTRRQGNQSRVLTMRAKKQKTRDTCAKCARMVQPFTAVMVY